MAFHCLRFAQECLWSFAPEKLGAPGRWSLDKQTPGSPGRAAQELGARFVFSTVGRVTVPHCLLVGWLCPGAFLSSPPHHPWRRGSASRNPLVSLTQISFSPVSHPHRNIKREVLVKQTKGA